MTKNAGKKKIKVCPRFIRFVPIFFCILGEKSKGFEIKRHRACSHPNCKSHFFLSFGKTTISVNEGEKYTAKILGSCKLNVHWYDNLTARVTVR